MKIKIFGEEKNTSKLLDKVHFALEELGLSEFIEVDITNDSKLKTKLNIKKEPALIVEEEELDFIDTIFEGTIPNDEDLKSMFISIIGGQELGSSCDPHDCGSCSLGC